MSDYIKREDAIKSNESQVNFCKQEGFPNPEWLHINSIKNNLKLVKAVDVVVQMHGKWIGGELGHCSCCGHEGCASDIWNDGQINYCPNCGARMDGES